MAEIPTLFLSVPKEPPSKDPRLDRLTRRLTAAWRERVPEPRIGRAGTLICSCGTQAATGGTYLIGKKGAQIRVDAFCVHRLAFHRDEMSRRELDLVSLVGQEEFLPTPQELRDPPIARTHDTERPSTSP